LQFDDLDMFCRSAIVDYSHDWQVPLPYLLAAIRDITHEIALDRLEFGLLQFRSPLDKNN